jgi:drug/metabolite transporter (DMT)-like permease
MEQTIINPESGNGEFPFKTIILTTCLCMLFGANAVAVKISLTGIGIYTTAALRFGGAALLLFTWSRLTHKNIRINRKQFSQLAFLTLIFFFQISFFYSGQSRTSATHGVLIANLLPFVIMILAHYLLPDDKINSHKVIGLLLGFAGVALLFSDSLQVSIHHSLHGDILIVCGVIFWGCNATFVKKIIGDYNPLQITLYPMLIGTPVYTICAILFDEPMIISLSPEVIFAMLYQTVVTATFGFIIWNSLISKYGATTLHSFIFIMPVSGVFFGIVLLGDPVTSSLIGSIFLVTTGLLVVNRRLSPKITKK